MGVAVPVPVVVPQAVDPEAGLVTVAVPVLAEAVGLAARVEAQLQLNLNGHPVRYSQTIRLRNNRAKRRSRGIQPHRKVQGEQDQWVALQMVEAVEPVVISPAKARLPIIHPPLPPRKLIPTTRTIPVWTRWSLQRRIIWPRVVIGFSG